MAASKEGQANVKCAARLPHRSSIHDRESSGEGKCGSPSSTSDSQRPTVYHGLRVINLTDFFKQKRCRSHRERLISSAAFINQQSGRFWLAQYKSLYMTSCSSSGIDLHPVPSARIFLLDANFVMDTIPSTSCKHRNTPMPRCKMMQH